jgi:hypothetical protein
MPTHLNRERPGDEGPLVKAAAREYARRHLFYCRVRPGQKVPKDPCWPTRCILPDEFDEQDSIGIVGGPQSHCGFAGQLALTGIDLDAEKAVELADRFLLPTGMIEGRAGKPRSHRWFALVGDSIPPEWTSTAPQTAPRVVEQFGFAGPRIKSYRDADGRELLCLKGTGSLMVAPPSYHRTGEQRVWEGGEMGLPAVLNFAELLGPVEELARRCGWEEDEVEVAGPGTVYRGGPIRAGRFKNAVRRASGYAEVYPPAVSGQGGDPHTFRLCLTLVGGFGLPGRLAFQVLMREFNWRCRPPWKPADLARKLNDAIRIARDDPRRRRGWKLDD